MATRATGRGSGHSGAAKPVVLMTGATGFLGGAIGKALAADYTVVGLDRRPVDMAHAECVGCDLTSDQSIDEAIRQVKSRYGARIASVVHLAGYFDFSGEPSPLYRQGNVAGTPPPPRAPPAPPGRLQPPPAPGDRTNKPSPAEPRWVYPQSKLETESVVAHEHGAIPYVLLRIAGVYTQVVQPPTLAHQISWIFERQFKGRVFPGETAHGQSFIHIDDLADAVVRIVQRRGSLPPDLKLLVGEPTAFLDIYHRVAFYEVVTRLKEECGISALVASHDLSLCAEYGERIVLLSAGRVMASGKPEEVLTPENVWEAYGVAVTCDRNPATGAVRVTPLRSTT